MADASEARSVDTGPDASPRRRNLAVVAGGVLLLVIGAVVFVLGSGAASNAADDLTHARRGRDTQQAVTRRARQCESDLRAGLPQVVTAGSSLLITAAQITSQDQQEVQATHDGQATGSQNRFGDYNGTVDRANAAVGAANALIGSVNQQLTALDTDARSLETACVI